MNITAVDELKNLYRVENVFTPDLVEKILATEWLTLPWTREKMQDEWARRRIVNNSIPWIAAFDEQLTEHWHTLGTTLGLNIFPYGGTSFWVDEPGFTVNIHTDGELLAALQLTWVGADPNLGTTFYWDKNPNSLRYQTPFQANAGYSMINRADESGYRALLWHGMLTPVPAGTVRVCSYTVMQEFD